MKHIVRALVRWLAPGWLLLAGCGGVERQSCYAQADLWLTQKAAECERTEGSWSECTARPKALAEHKEMYSSCR